MPATITPTDDAPVPIGLSSSQITGSPTPTSTPAPSTNQYPSYVRSMLGDVGQCVGRECGEEISHYLPTSATSLDQPQNFVKPDANGMYPEGTIMHVAPDANRGMFDQGHYFVVHYINGVPHRLESNVVGHDFVSDSRPLTQADISAATRGGHVHAYLPPGTARIDPLAATAPGIQVASSDTANEPVSVNLSSSQLMGASPQSSDQPVQVGLSSAQIMGGSAPVQANIHSSQIPITNEQTYLHNQNVQAAEQNTADDDMMMGGIQMAEPVLAKKLQAQQQAQPPVNPNAGEGPGQYAGEDGPGSGQKPPQAPSALDNAVHAASQFFQPVEHGLSDLWHIARASLGEIMGPKSQANTPNPQDLAALKASPTGKATISTLYGAMQAPAAIGKSALDLVNPTDALNSKQSGSDVTAAKSQASGLIPGTFTDIINNANYYLEPNHGGKELINIPANWANEYRTNPVGFGLNGIMTAGAIAGLREGIAEGAASKATSATEAADLAKAHGVGLNEAINGTPPDAIPSILRAAAGQFGKLSEGGGDQDVINAHQQIASALLHAANEDAVKNAADPVAAATAAVKDISTNAPQVAFALHKTGGLSDDAAQSAVNHFTAQSVADEHFGGDLGKAQRAIQRRIDTGQAQDVGNGQYALTEPRAQLPALPDTVRATNATDLAPILQKTWNLTPEGAQHMASIYDARADAWAKTQQEMGNPATKADWYANSMFAHGPDVTDIGAQPSTQVSEPKEPTVTVKPTPSMPDVKVNAPVSVVRDAPNDQNYVNGIPTSSIATDPERFQYKMNFGAGGETGSTRNARVWNKDLAGALDVWQDPADGQAYVVNGHNRLALANRLGIPNLDVRYLDADTAADAKRRGAIANIGQGQGTPFDAAKLIREHNYTLNDLAGYGVDPTGRIARQGLALSNLADPIFNAAHRGQIPLERAATIGEKLPNQTDQFALMKMIDDADKKGRSVTNDVVAELADSIANGPKVDYNTSSMFGDESGTRSAAIERAQIAAHINSILKRHSAKLNSAADNATILESGNNKIDAETSRRVATGLSQAHEVFDRLKNAPGVVSDILNKYAAKLAEGKENATAIRNNALSEVRAAIPEVLRGEKAGIGQNKTEAEPATAFHTHDDNREGSEGRGIEGQGQQSFFQSGKFVPVDIPALKAAEERAKASTTGSMFDDTSAPEKQPSRTSQPKAKQLGMDLSPEGPQAPTSTETGTLFQNQGAKGSITFTSDMRRIFRGLTNPDASTGIHELGHSIVHDLVQAAKRGHTQSIADVTTLEKHYGKFGADGPSTAQHEAIARDFEGYVREGKAPTAALQAAFQHMAAVLKQIYQTWGHVAHPEVKAVFDRAFGGENALGRVSKETPAETAPKNAPVKPNVSAPDDKYAESLNLDRNTMTDEERQVARKQMGLAGYVKPDSVSWAEQNARGNALGLTNEYLRTKKNVGEIPKQLSEDQRGDYLNSLRALMKHNLERVTQMERVPDSQRSAGFKSALAQATEDYQRTLNEHGPIVNRMGRSFGKLADDARAFEAADRGDIFKQTQPEAATSVPKTRRTPADKGALNTVYPQKTAEDALAALRAKGLVGDKGATLFQSGEPLPEKSPLRDPETAKLLTDLGGYHLEINGNWNVWRTQMLKHVPSLTDADLRNIHDSIRADVEKKTGVVQSPDEPTVTMAKTLARRLGTKAAKITEIIPEDLQKSIADKMAARLPFSKTEDDAVNNAFATLNKGVKKNAVGRYPQVDAALNAARKTYNDQKALADRWKSMQVGRQTIRDGILKTLPPSKVPAFSNEFSHIPNDGSDTSFKRLAEAWNKWGPGNEGKGARNTNLVGQLIRAGYLTGTHVIGKVLLGHDAAVLRNEFLLRPIMRILPGEYSPMPTGEGLKASAKAAGSGMFHTLRTFGGVTESPNLSVLRGENAANPPSQLHPPEITTGLPWADAILRSPQRIHFELPRAAASAEFKSGLDDYAGRNAHAQKLADPTVDEAAAKAELLAHPTPEMQESAHQYASNAMWFNDNAFTGMMSKLDVALNDLSKKVPVAGAIAKYIRSSQVPFPRILSNAIGDAIETSAGYTTLPSLYKLANFKIINGIAMKAAIEDAIERGIPADEATADARLKYGSLTAEQKLSLKKTIAKGIVGAMAVVAGGILHRRGLLTAPGDPNKYDPGSLQVGHKSVNVGYYEPLASPFLHGAMIDQLAQRVQMGDSLTFGDFFNLYTKPLENAPLVGPVSALAEGTDKSLSRLGANLIPTPTLLTEAAATFDPTQDVRAKDSALDYKRNDFPGKIGRNSLPVERLTGKYAAKDIAAEPTLRTSGTIPESNGLGIGPKMLPLREGYLGDEKNATEAEVNERRIALLRALMKRKAGG